MVFASAELRCYLPHRRGAALFHYSLKFHLSPSKLRVGREFLRQIVGFGKKIGQNTAKYYKIT